MWPTGGAAASLERCLELCTLEEYKDREPDLFGVFVFLLVASQIMFSAWVPLLLIEITSVVFSTFIKVLSQTYNFAFTVNMRRVSWI